MARVNDFQTYSAYISEGVKATDINLHIVRTVPAAFNPLPYMTDQRYKESEATTKWEWKQTVDLRTWSLYRILSQKTSLT